MNISSFSFVQSLTQLFMLQARVIWALMMRELHTRYGRENIGYLWMVGEPIMFCAGVAVVWTSIRAPYEHGLQMTAFVITGYVPLTMWRHCVSRAIKAFEANGGLLFHRQVTPLDLIASRVSLEVAGSLIAGALVASGAMLLGYMGPPQDIGLMYVGLAYHAFFCLACALLIAALSERSDFIEKVIGIVMYLSLPVSGAFTMVSWIPQHYRWILLLSPSVQDCEMIRGGQFGPQSHPIYSFSYTAGVTGVMLLIGLSLTLRSRRFIVVN
jgi:capsular polysaccharide transport system permease protein